MTQFLTALSLRFVLFALRILYTSKAAIRKMITANCLLAIDYDS